MASSTTAISNDLLQVLSQTLSPNADSRKQAERLLSDASKRSGHLLEVLRLIASMDGNNANPAIRQAAAVHFKNIVKKAWDAEAEDGTDGIEISDNDRQLIKSHLVELMCTVPSQIQSQFSEAIALIATIDFPKKWDNLLNDLIQKFHSPDPNIVSGVLLTLSSILKRFKQQVKSDELYADLAYVLERLQEPLLTLLKSLSVAVDSYANDTNKLKPIFASLRSICRIFYSLNYHDLPEYFEDHMGEWMTEFAKYLKYTNPLLVDEDEDDEAGPIDTLQSAIILNLYLYGDKDEEPFIPYLGEFTSIVWNLLMNTSKKSKHDMLATTCIKFLSSLIGKPMHRALFQSKETLQQIISNIVIPNLQIREVDQEQFEDDPAEFILSDMEESDSDSRRKRSQELLRAMCRQFEEETTLICMESIGKMLQEFTASNGEKWISKDAAIHLMLGISIRAGSVYGVSAINDRVDLMQFFTTHILTELQDSNHSSRPMVKASAIKFAWTFRNQFSKDHIASLMPLLIAHLSSPMVVVHTYSAAAIEKFLICKENTGTGAIPVASNATKFGGNDLKPFLETLFPALFTIVDNQDWNENEYVMKCIMRSLSSARDEIVQVTNIVLEKLNAALFVVAKNPRNPHYNHFMFESIAILVKAVCSKHPEHVATFEQLLFPPFQTVLQMDVSEFTPYVFQILAQLLEYRPTNTGLGEAYQMLLAPLLAPVLWESKGNVPALTRLLQAYLLKGTPEIIANNQLMALLGVFQKLIASKGTEVGAFDLLGAITKYIPFSDLEGALKQIFNLLLQRLQSAKAPRYKRLVTGYFAQFIGQYGSQKWFTIMDSFQPGLGKKVLSQVWMPRLEKDEPVRMEIKIQAVGLTKLVCESPTLLNDTEGQQVLVIALLSLTKILTSKAAYFGKPLEELDQTADIGYDPTFSKLHFATRAPMDPFEENKDPILNFVKCFQQTYSTSPLWQTVLSSGSQADPKGFVSFQSIFANAGVQL